MGFFTKRGGGRTILGAAAVLGMALAAWTVGLLGCDGGDRDDDSYDGWADPKAVVKGTLKDPRDQKEYRTVKIGTQTWMAENLNYTPTETETTVSSHCYNDSAVYCDKYGRLYSQAANVCPDGWRVPSYKDWDTLITVTGGERVAGKKLKSKNGWNPNDGTDDFGFSAQSGGKSYEAYQWNTYIKIRDYEGVGQSGYWWTDYWESSYGDPDYNYLTWFDPKKYGKGSVWESATVWGGGGSDYEFSVRCIKN